MSLKVVSANMVAILMMSAKVATLGLLIIKAWYHNFCQRRQKILLFETNYIVNVVRWLKFGDSRMSMRKVINSIL